MKPLRDDQYISLFPTDSPAEDAEMDTGAESHGQTAQGDGQQVGTGLTQLPADTPRLPGPKGVNFQQFCEELRTDLPGLLRETPVQVSALLHHWSMRSLVRSDVPTGS